MESVAGSSSLLQSLRRLLAGYLMRRRPERRASAASPHVKEARPAPEEAAARDPFEPFAALLDVPVPLPSEEPDVLEDEEDSLWAARVLEHFSLNRPSPASAPSLSLRVLGLLAEPRTQIGDLVPIISSDPALSAAILAAANSAQHRGVDEVETVRPAVVRLGLQEAARVVGAVAARSLFKPEVRAERQAFPELSAQLYARAVAVAYAAAALGLRLPGARSDRTFLGGMLYDVGRAVALRSFSALAVEDGSSPSEDRVARVLEAVHVEVGVSCHEIWRLPQFLQELALLHHDAHVPAEPGFVDLHVVRLCGALLELRTPGTAFRASRELVQSAGALGLGPREVRVVDAELRDALQRASSLPGLK